MKEKLTPSLRSTEKSIVNQNSLRVLNILYVANFCETRKISSNAIRALFLLLNVWKSKVCTKLGALKIIFQRGYTTTFK